MYFLLLSAAVLCASVMHTPKLDKYGCLGSGDLLSDCYGSRFSGSDGYDGVPCKSDADCRRTREPPKWCRLGDFQGWFRSGCHCDKKKGVCVVDRITMTGNGSDAEYALCVPVKNWTCPE